MKEEGLLVKATEEEIEEVLWDMGKEGITVMSDTFGEKHIMYAVATAMIGLSMAMDKLEKAQLEDTQDFETVQKAFMYLLQVATQMALAVIAFGKDTPGKDMVRQYNEAVAVQNLVGEKD